MDRAHRSLAPKPPAGARPRDIVVCFHFYKSKEALTRATRNRSSIEYKGDKLQLFSDSSPITLAKRHSLRPITTHLQQHKVPYYWGFPFRLNVTMEGVQHTLRDLMEGDAFLKCLGLPPLPAGTDQTSPATLGHLAAPARIWTPVRGRGSRAYSTPQRSQHSRPPALSTAESPLDFLLFPLPWDHDSLVDPIWETVLPHH